MTKHKFAASAVSSAVRDVALTLAMVFLLSVVVWVLVLGNPPATAGTLDACPTELFFSEYIEGDSWNKALEIYNGTGSDIAFTGQYTVARYTNGSSTVSNDVVLNGTVANGDVFVIAHGSAAQAILDEADQTSGVLSFNGNDAMALFHDGAIVDVIGRIGEDPGAPPGWGTDPTNTYDNTLVRKSSIMAGDTNGSDLFDPAAEWDGYDQDTFTYLGSHTIDVCGEPPIGGITYPNDVARLLVPWWALAALGCSILAGGAVALKKRVG